MPQNFAARKPSSPAAALVVPLRDVDEVRALFPNWQGRFEQLSAGRFEGRLRVVRGRLVRIAAVEGNQRLRVRGRDAAGLVSAYPVLAGNAAAVWHGRRLAPGQLVVHGPAAETDHCSARQTAHSGVSVRPEALEEAARVLLNADAASLPCAREFLSPPPEAFAGLGRQLARLLGLGVADPSMIESAEGRQFEQECVRSLVAAIFPASDPRPSLSLPARSELIRRAEEFMRSRLADPAGMIDLCRELGAGDRTLRLAFRERFGLGPMAYCRCLRLNAVRSRLKGDRFVAISDAAREFGFRHLGNFAADYRRLFGERPSDTPRRGAG